MTEMERRARIALSSAVHLAVDLTQPDGLGARVLTIAGHRFSIRPTGDVGCDSGRPRYLVVCATCGVVLHENTTGPASRLDSHLAPFE